MVSGFNKKLRVNWLPETVVTTILLIDGKILGRHADHIHHNRVTVIFQFKRMILTTYTPFLVSLQQPASANAPNELHYSQRSHRPPEHFQT